MSRFKPQEKKKQTQKHTKNKPICGDASQNGPRSYTDLAIKLGQVKDFATTSPSSQY